MSLTVSSLQTFELDQANLQLTKCSHNQLYLIMSTLNSRHIDFLLPNFSVRKELTPEASASLNNEVGAFNAGVNTSNPISFRSRTACVKMKFLLIFRTQIIFSTRDRSLVVKYRVLFSVTEWRATATFPTFGIVASSLQLETALY